ncbi:hypothetical protein [Kitasatospora sp. NBC_01266]|uniref:hypothetical protein n=1 Tax=Kitasatospora sp. NBC_01266 TaxID=2903572 RepID=UPI002E3261B6|nr:hypothetical protein [Kitasatospora sp. NBC_01266]
MRLRNTVAAAAGALLLVLAVPSSSYAATGEFHYRFGADDRGTLHDPEGGRCVNLFGATPDDPAFAPENLTDATAVAYLDFDCKGSVYRVMPPGNRLGDRLKLRSVVFS